jgi:hypothetical protein
MNASYQEYMWRSNLAWPELVSLAEGIIKRWSSVTKFVTQTDSREHIWTVRHSSVAQPFLILNEDALRGSVPRNGNPMAFLLLMGIYLSRPTSLEITFANGQKIDLTKFELEDLSGLLPQATHAAHRKLAELSMQQPGKP